MCRCILIGLVLVLIAAPLVAETTEGYYRYPTIHDDVVVFTSEGDLWKVSVHGGLARRLTTHQSVESHAALSPDGKRVAFSASYEGPTETYVMDVDGGQPDRLTWGASARTIGWTPQGEVLYTTSSYSTLPDAQLVAVDPRNHERRRLPLSQAAEGVYEPSGETLFFARYSSQGSKTKRYMGGTAQDLWSFKEGDDEAVLLTGDFAGTSHQPMFHDGRVYFASDRDGTMNVHSMAPDGSDVRQHTEHADGWDVKDPDLDGGRIVYQSGADLYVYDIASDTTAKLDVRLSSDFDQTRERWIEEPATYLTAAHLSPDGDRVAMTARGQVFVAPVKDGRFVRVTRDEYRYRDARFLPGSEDKSELVVLSDASDEVELWTLDPRGVDDAEQLTSDAHTLRFNVYPSPDGRRVAYIDKDDELWILDRETKEQTKVASSVYFSFRGLDWSSDGRWLAFALPSTNQMAQLFLYNVEDKATTELTSDRFHSYSPAFSADGKFLYFLSDRNLESSVGSPWGLYQPTPFIPKPTKIYMLTLQKGERSPFAADDELAPEMEEEDEEGDDDREADVKKDKKDKKGKKGKKDDKKDGDDDEDKDATKPVEIDLEGIAGRLDTVPVEAGNYGSLSANDGALFWMSFPISGDASLQAIKTERKAEVKTLTGGVRSYELSADGKKALLRKVDDLYVVDAGAEELSDLDKSKVDLGAWTLSVRPQLEWRQLFIDAWRLQRDYFWDPGMSGVDWIAVRDKYLPLVDRVRDRDELSDVFGEMIGELSTLHEFVGGGDRRRGDEDVGLGSLGAILLRDEAAGGYKVNNLYRSDPDMPEERGPLTRPGVDVGEGDFILAINGVDVLTVSDPAVLLREQAGRQVLLSVRDGDDGKEREVIVEPISGSAERELRYDQWELERRERVDELGAGEIGYVHLRAMGRRNFTEWARHYFPIYNRKGIILDVRHNNGGNIDSWILGSLVRRTWMWWKGRTGMVYRNMQFSFHGHMVVLTDAHTASDGEAFADGFRRLGLGDVIGMRTWGGEIWLTASNRLIDRGIATAAEFGVYGPEGEWLIEGHGLEPDEVVDNPPHATFVGGDAQLEAAVEHLKRKIAEEPPEVPEPPPYPDKSFNKVDG